jgi:phage N-6-adenine-methyltransferase
VHSSVMFSSASDEWETPQAFFDELCREFEFTLDAAASPDNTKCEHFYSAERDALAEDWSVADVYGERPVVWLNCPYSRCAEFVAKAAEEARKGVTTVMLIPARTDTRYFHAHIYDEETHNWRAGVEVRFVKGRLKFGQQKNSAPFPSMLVIFRPVA